MGWGATQVNLPRTPLVYQVELVAAPSEVSARTVPSPRRVRQPEPTPEPDPEPESEIKVPETKPAVTEKPQKEVERLEAQEEAAKPELAPVAVGERPEGLPQACRLDRAASLQIKGGAAGARRLTGDGSIALSPAWSPSGGAIAYMSYLSCVPSIEYVGVMFNPGRAILSTDLSVARSYT